MRDNILQSHISQNPNLIDPFYHAHFVLKLQTTPVVVPLALTSSIRQ